MIQVCDLSFANSSITDTLGNYSLVSSGTVTISGHTYPANTDPILYGTDSSYNYVEFGQTATYSNGAIIQAGIPDYGSENWAVEFRARVTSAIPVNTGSYAIFFGCSAPYDDNGTIRTGGYWAISVDSYPDIPNELRFFYDYNNEDLTLKDNLDLTSWHLYKVTKTAEDILTLHIDGVLVATIDIEQQTGFKSRATLGSFALLGAVEELPTASHIQTNQLVRLADVKVYADPMGHAEKAISLDNLSRVFRNYNTWLGAQLSGQIGDGTLTIKVNGATAGTFTANQSTAATANITVPTAVSELTNDSGYLTASSNLDASKLTSGTVDIARLPQGALERLIKVANEAARYALTTADVQLGDTVQQLDTGIMYIVTDADHLDSAAGYTEYTAGTAASVPWSGVTGKPTFAAVATSGAYSDLTGTPTIPTVNNATLTIQRNGTTIDTFTANASVDKTINISTDDDTKIPLAGSNAISGDLIPSSDGTVNLGSVSYQWNNAYIKSLTINGVACGDILTHNASEFVDVSSNQTIGGVKTFSDGDKTLNDSAPLRIQGCNHGNEFSSNARTVLEVRSNRDIADKSCIYLTKFRQNRPQGSMGVNDSVILTMDVLENEVRTNDLLRFTAHNWINDAPTEVYLEPATKASNIQSFLGSSTRPWGDTSTNAINGINPGALSLPSSTYINVDTTNWDLTCQNELMGSFTPTADGWLMLHVANSGTSEVNFWVIGGVIRINNKSTLTDTNNDNFNMITIPVEKDVTYNIYGNASEYVAGRSIEYCRFMPCRGNV